ncbi:MAG: PaaI family thioesterase [Myxococcota bacterium]
MGPRSQPGSRSCFVCGFENPHGLGAVFYDDGAEVWTEVTPGNHHQSWPGILHGGVVAAILDETIGRVAFLYDRWVQTAKLDLRFLAPAPLEQPLRARGRLVQDRRRLMVMEGELLGPDGTRLAEAKGTFIPVPDAVRAELAAQLGDDFEAWERWMASHRG